MKHFSKTIILLVITLSFLLFGCNNKSIDTELQREINIVKNEIGEKIFAKLSKKIDSKDAKYIAEKFQEIYSKVDLKINNKTVESNKAVVNVSINTPDINKLNSINYDIIKQKISKIDYYNLSEKDEYKIIIESIKGTLDAVKTTSKSGNIVLEKVNGEWQIENSESIKNLLF